MQFKNPELLYFLFLLLIPILIHLFQLRRFKKISFTNVAFLNKVKIQSRKSSELKKWIVLCLRLLAIAAAVFAFAQPFIPASSIASQKVEYAIYLDNSFSMQMPSQRGNLLTQAQQELIEMVPSQAMLHFFTNNSSFKNVSSSVFKQEVLATSFTDQSLSLPNVIEKAKSLFSKSNHLQKIILVSDFQAHQADEVASIKASEEIVWLKITPEKKVNFSIDELIFDDAEKLLKIAISSSEISDASVQVSVFNGEQLLAKQLLAMEGNDRATTEISLGEQEIPYGRVEIQDEALRYDNSFYFSINALPPIQVLCVYEEESEFLQRIFKSNKAFSYTSTPIEKLDFSVFSNQDLVILNGLQNIRTSLRVSLQKWLAEGGNLVVIPPSSQALEAYNNSLLSLGLPVFKTFISKANKVTTIHFEQELMKDVFTSSISNFEYPTTQSHYEIQGLAEPVLSYANAQPFLVASENSYVFASSFKKENTNFTSSPLIVPIFYNMAFKSVLQPPIYDVTDKVHTYQLPAELSQDDVIQLVMKDNSYIPQQRRFPQMVEINTSELALQAGTYQAKKEEEVLRYVSFNYPREESKLSYLQLEEVGENIEYQELTDFFNNESRLQNIDEYWKALLIFVALMLLLEAFVVRFFK